MSDKTNELKTNEQTILFDDKIQFRGIRPRVINRVIGEVDEVPYSDPTDDLSLVETAGYMSKKTQVECLRNAGNHLATQRRLEYPSPIAQERQNPYEVSEEELYLNPLIQKTMDRTEVCRLNIKARNSIETQAQLFRNRLNDAEEQQRRDARARLAEEAARASMPLQNAPQGDPTP